LGSSIVRVIILAAGQGKRLLPLTAEVPKALLDIHGQTLIGRQIEALSDFSVSTEAVQLKVCLLASRMIRTCQGRSVRPGRSSPSYGRSISH
jgi:NDP-sugar pyrophosphorylase family protein